MASKRFKNQVCAYCATLPSFTGDHIFAREFFLERHRANLPKAPICLECNNEKSKLEHHLTTVFPFGGRHPTAHENLITQVPARLHKNQRLHREISKRKVEIELVEGSDSRPAIAVPVDADIIEKAFVLIIKGLAWHHWRLHLDDHTHISVQSMTAAQSRFFEDNFFSLKSVKRASNNLGEGTFIYEGVQDINNPALTAWRLHVYGGALFMGDDNIASPEIGIVSCPRNIARGMA